MAYGGSNDDVIDDVTWPWKVKVVIPIPFRPVISKTARDRDSVLTGHHLPPEPYIKAVKKFTWRIYALSERLLVFFTYLIMISISWECESVPVAVYRSGFRRAEGPYTRCLSLSRVLLVKLMLKADWCVVWSPSRRRCYYAESSASPPEPPNTGDTFFHREWWIDGIVWTRKQ